MLVLLGLAWLWPVVQAEIGLRVVAGDGELNNQPVRLNDGKLSAVGGGPVLQVYFSREKLIVSDHLISAAARGAGIGLGTDSSLGVSMNPVSGFSNQSGWLEFESNPLFLAKPADGHWQLFSGSANNTEAIPVMFQVAEVIYDQGHRSGLGSNAVPALPLSSLALSTDPSQSARRTAPWTNNTATPRPSGPAEDSLSSKKATNVRGRTHFTTFFETVFNTFTVGAYTQTVTVYQDVIYETKTETVFASSLLSASAAPANRDPNWESSVG